MVTIKMSFLSLVQTSKPVVCSILSFCSLLGQNAFPSLDLILKTYGLIFSPVLHKDPRQVYLCLLEIGRIVSRYVFLHISACQHQKYLQAA